MFNFVVMEGPETGTEIQEISYSINLSVNAGSAPGGAYNKMLTIWDSDMESWMTALISLIVFLVITVLIAIVIYPRIVRAVGNKRNPDLTAKFLGTSRAGLLGMMLTFAVSESIFINGGSLMIQDFAYMAARALYIAFGALLIWAVYDASLNIYLRRRKIGDDSLIPLFIALGKIVIAMGAFGWALTELGADWTYIITGMGIIGIVLGYGAQSTLTQFFSGLSILCTRPFKPGDLIRMDGSLDTLKVLDVGFMISKFENWANAEVFTMPNDKVTSSTIINVTKGSKAYRVFIFVGIAYGSDVKLAKKLMVEAANEHEHVIKDGSFEPPAARLNEFADSALTMRLAAYVDDFENSYLYAGQLREAINDKFNANGIVIAFPQMDVHVINDGAPVRDDIITDKTIADKNAE